MFRKTKNKNKKQFCKSCFQCFSSENVLIKHKENCLSINGKQTVKLEEGIIKFENCFKQIPVPFKIYADFERIMKEYFNKNLIMSEEEEHLFQKRNSCWICKKFINNNNNNEENARDHCHVTGKFRGAAHRNCNINFQLTKNIPVMFHNLRGYHSHLIFTELDKFDVKIPR